MSATDSNDERDGDRPQGWRWRLDGRLPPVEAALPFSEAARAALHRSARNVGRMRLPDDFHGGGNATPDHGHAFWLPEDADGDGVIDHFLVFAESGVDADLVRGLAGIDRLVLPGLCDVRLEPSWMGRRGPGGLFGPAHAWQGVTPYVTPRWRGRADGGTPRARDAPDLQLCREIEARGMPSPRLLSFRPAAFAGERVVPASFFAVARARRKPPGDAVAAFVDLEFSEPVWGALAFGYGAYFGLGLMVPIRN